MKQKVILAVAAVLLLALTGYLAAQYDGVIKLFLIAVVTALMMFVIVEVVHYLHMRMDEKKRKAALKKQAYEQIDEIKAFFLRYDGHVMSMYRDDMKMYEVYHALDSDTKEAWFHELLTQHMTTFESRCDENTWFLAERVWEWIPMAGVPVEPYYERWLARVIELAPALDKHQRILLLEYFAGRTDSQEDGAIYDISQKPALIPSAITAMRALADFTVDESDNEGELGWKDVPRRFEEAKEAVRRAYDKFVKR